MPTSSPPSRRCATPRSGCAWCAARPGSACTRSTGWRGGATGRLSCARSCARRTTSTSTPTPTCSSASSRTTCARRSATSSRASLAPESGGDYEDEHRITRFDGSTGLDPAARQDLLRRGTGGAARHALDRPDRRHHRPQARRGGERAARLDGALVERRDLLDRSGADHPDLEPGRGAALRLHAPPRRSAGRSRMHLPGRACATSSRALRARPSRGKPVVLETVRRHKDGRLVPVGISGAPIFDADGIAWSASRRCIAT